jgi:hypothetical protein
MSINDLAALARRHLIAVAIVLVVVAATAYTFKHTPPTYTESATVVLKAPGPNPYWTFGAPLITAGEVTVDWMTGAQGEQQLSRDGVSGDYDVGMVNYANMEYPDYAVPYVAVSASGPSPAAAHQAFVTVVRVFDSYLAARQDNIVPAVWITTTIVGDTGPIIQSGSRLRTFAGLAVLTLVAAYLLTRFLDRHPIRPSALRHPQWRSIHRPVPGRQLRHPARPGAA